MRKANATSLKHIGTNPKEVSTWKVLETYFFSHLLTTDALSKTVKSVDLGFLSKERENGAFFSTESSVTNALCKKHEGTTPSRSKEKMTKLT